MPVIANGTGMCMVQTCRKVCCSCSETNIVSNKACTGGPLLMPEHHPPTGINKSLGGDGRAERGQERCPASGSKRDSVHNLHGPQEDPRGHVAVKAAVQQWQAPAFLSPPKTATIQRRPPTSFLVPWDIYRQLLWCCYTSER